MAHPVRGYTEQLPSGSWRVTVRAGSDPLTGKPIRLRATAKTWERAQAELARLPEGTSAGRRPDGDATVGELLKQYAAVADWDLSTREANEGYLRRTILPALGEMKLCRVRGPVPGTLYARLRKCSNLTCTGKPFIEHSS